MYITTAKQIEAAAHDMQFGMCRCYLLRTILGVFLVYYFHLSVLPGRTMFIDAVS